MLVGNAPYAEVSPNAVVAAIQQGADVKIVSDNVLTVAEFVWAVKPDSPIKAPRDMKGKKVGYTNPRSTSQALATLVAQSGGLKAEDVELVKTGGFGEGIAALDTGIVDVAPIPEPLWSKFEAKYRPIARAADLLPPIDNVVGIAAGYVPPEKGEFIKAVIRARRRAVAYMHEHTEVAASLIAKVYNLDPSVGLSAVKNLINSRTDGVEYWGTGQIYLDGLKRAIEVQKMVGAISGDVDAAKLIDTRCQHRAGRAARRRQGVHAVGAIGQRRARAGPDRSRAAPGRVLRRGRAFWLREVDAARGNRRSFDGKQRRSRVRGTAYLG
jgi:NitT/TauT family transport system substrate-binding protein